MRTIVIIPAYNEDRTVAEVVRNVREYIPDVVVVDDGSSDATSDRARAAGAAVVRHCINRGLGAALGTGIAAALCMNADAIATLDADGQHDPADIAALIAPVMAGTADIVIGTRFSRECRIQSAECKKSAPWARRAFNSIANVLTRVLFGVQCSDTQSGFRCLSRRAAEQIEIRTNRMEASSEILAEVVRHQLHLVEVPIRTIYTDYSLSKGQGLTVGIRTAWALFLRRIF